MERRKTFLKGADALYNVSHTSKQENQLGRSLS